jgi:hypothetical protein
MMLYDALEAVKLELEQSRSLYRKYLALSKKTSKYKGIRLSIHHRQKSDYYQKWELGHRGKYIGRASDREVEGIQKHYLLTREIQALETNIKACELFVKRHCETNPNILRESFPKAYKFSPEICKDIVGVIDLKKWGSEPVSTYRKDNLVHNTERGEKVRSKSEMVLANMFFSKGIPYKYEAGRMIAGHYIHPDFTLFSKRVGREVIWEHFGLMNDPEYRDNYGWKMKIYAEAGFYPGVNLITSFDDESGGLDAAHLRRIMKLWFE